ncbi:MAG: ABC transporter substrate-binding protein [Acidimicrobiia bacterium]
MRNRSHLRLAVAALLSFSLIAAACGDDDDSADEAPEQGGGGNGSGATGDPIRIGVPLPVSGALASVGEPMLKAAELAIDTANEAGGVEIDGVDHLFELVELDTKGAPEDSLTVMKKAVETDGLQLFAGFVSSPAFQAAVPTLQANDTVLIIAGSLLPVHDGDKIFTVLLPIKQQTQAQVDFAMSELGAEKFALFYDQTHTSYMDNVDDLKDYIEDQGGEVVADERFSSGDSDFRAQLNSIKSSGAEVVLEGGYPTPETSIFKQRDELDMTDIAWFYSGTHTAAQVQENGIADGLANAYAPFGREAKALAADGSPEAKALVDAMQAEYKMDLGLLGGQMYAAISTLMEGVRVAGSSDPGDVAAALAKLKPDFDGIKVVDVVPTDDDLLFNDDGSVNYDIYIRKFEGTDWTVIGSLADFL